MLPLELRRADPDPAGPDSRLVWEWRNDPVTRAMSRSSEPVPWPDHQAWFARVAADPERHLLMVTGAGAPVGVVRFDRAPDGSAEIHINLDPARRGQGLGGRALHAACAHGFRTLGLIRIDAVVKPDNLASRRIFEAVGFVFTGERDDLRRYRLAHTELHPYHGRPA